MIDQRLRKGERPWSCFVLRREAAAGGAQAATPPPGPWHPVFRFGRVWVAYGLASPVLAATPPPPGKAQIVNQTGADIWVGFWSPASTITWGSGCQQLAASKTTAKVLKGATCIATVTSTNVRSRFCASKTAGAVNCSVAQQQHLTVIETNFQPNCFGTKSSCIWYDISVIPFNPVPAGYGYCTDCTWNGNTKDPTCKPRP